MDNVKRSPIKLYLSKNELELCDQRAKEANLTRPNYIRQQLFGDVTPDVKTIPPSVRNYQRAVSVARTSCGGTVDATVCETIAAAVFCAIHQIDAPDGIPRNHCA
jgi:hypothetical protein